jgi:uncharacterized protein YdaU (DUF1376 family)
MSLPYMKMYWGDYLGDTTHLTAIEHGGYLLLIAHYWRTGSIPTDEIKLARVTRMTMKQWHKHGPTILEFFPNGKHKRIDAERQIANTKSEKNRRSAETRWNSNSDAKPLPLLETGDANALQMQSVGNAIHSHSQSIDNKAELNKHKRSHSLASFDRFWKAYPRKQNKGHAEKAWAKAIKLADPDQIISAVERSVWNEDKQFIPHPASWLNGKRWEDELPNMPVRLSEEEFEEQERKRIAYLQDLHRRTSNANS